jgi:deoxyhypusine synthase
MANNKFERDSRHYHTGVDDHLQPVTPLDLSQVNDLDDMLREMSHTAFGGRRLGEALETFEQMVKDKNAFVVLTLSGAMTVAKMGMVICDMIDRGFVHAIISTGALMTHGFVENTGRTHFKYDEQRMDDVKLYKAGYNRVYDTLELEQNLDDIEHIVHETLNTIDPKAVLSSRFMTQELGRWLSKNTKGRGILKSAFRMNVPVYIPALTDSELGLDIAMYNRTRVALGKKPMEYNPFFDLEHYTELINQQKKIAIFTIGGGVPRNWAQQVGPYLDLIQGRMPKGKAPKHISGKKFTYALRISPEPVHLGGLSGCTYSEGVSWGKFIPTKMGGRQSEVLEDATVAWPILVKGLIQRLEKAKYKVRKNFDLKQQLRKVASITKRYNLER